ncbi:hypothetical protein A8C56_14595 [Niabella ginsenosidivorans]|uniref:Uncharacterized protein n=1 Tax=Niabella ginsenosidivorans TaxID=1176587 RepID=A0A1A9I3Z3_9BACT|nr:hypothetical protein A8C56_14595 [Niabella ginsenosidivorans]
MPQQQESRSTAHITQLRCYFHHSNAAALIPCKGILKAGAFKWMIFCLQWIILWSASVQIRQGYQMLFTTG